MHHIGAIVALTLMSAVQLAACSSRVTTLDPDKQLSSLSTEDRQQYCEDQFQYLSTRVPKEDARKIKCATAATAVTIGGEADTEAARAACQQAYQACMSIPAPEPQSACDTFPAKAESCAATVGEATKCAEARADALAKVAIRSDDTCNNVFRTTSSDQHKDKADPAKTQACARVQLMCPKLFDESVSPAPGVSGTPGAPGAVKP